MQFPLAASRLKVHTTIRHRDDFVTYIMLRSIRTFSAAVRRFAAPSRTAVTLIATSVFAAAASTNSVRSGCARCLAEPNDDDSNDNPVIPSNPQVEGAGKPSGTDSTSGIAFLWNALKRKIQSMRKTHKEKRQQEATKEDGPAEILKSIQRQRDEDKEPVSLPPITVVEGKSRPNGPR